VGEVANLMVDSGLIVLTAFSLFKENRQVVRDMFKEGGFIGISIEAAANQVMGF
jgi:adenylylsulfate kinase-like enzyme